MTTRVLPRTLLLIVLGLTSIAAACGDDSDDSSTDAGGSGNGGKGGGGKGGKGGSGGSVSGSGGTGGTGGTAGKGGSGGLGGSGGSTGTDNMCTEEPPSVAVKCGGETCTTPEFPSNPCVVPCCIEVNGQSKCGAKSTSNMFPAACTLLAVADPSCADVDDMQGCCNHAKGKCGIISSARPGCITESMFVEIPDKACAKTPDNEADAGPDEPDAG